MKFYPYKKGTENVLAVLKVRDTKSFEVVLIWGGGVLIWGGGGSKKFPPFKRGFVAPHPVPWSIVGNYRPVGSRHLRGTGA